MNFQENLENVIAKNRFTCEVVAKRKNDVKFLRKIPIWGRFLTIWGWFQRNLITSNWTKYLFVLHLDSVRAIVNYRWKGPMTVWCVVTTVECVEMNVEPLNNFWMENVKHVHTGNVPSMHVLPFFDWKMSNTCIQEVFLLCTCFYFLIGKCQTRACRKSSFYARVATFWHPNILFMNPSTNFILKFTKSMVIFQPCI